jgi:hypothetical protein
LPSRSSSRQGLFTKSWLAFGLLEQTSSPGSTSVTKGIQLFGFAAAVLLLSSLSTLGKPFFSLLLLVAATRMLLSGRYEVGPRGRHSRGVGRLWARPDAARPRRRRRARARRRSPGEVLPLFRRGAAAESFAGYEHQLERLEAEAGVRQQL